MTSAESSFIKTWLRLVVFGQCSKDSNRVYVNSRPPCLERGSDGVEPSTLITQDIIGKKNGSIPLIDSGEYLRG